MDDVVNRFARELADAIAAAVAENPQVEACREKARAAGFEMKLTLEGILVIVVLLLNFAVLYGPIWLMRRSVERDVRKSNADYIAHTQQGDVPHASILYHAKMSFFIAGVSRRVSH